MVRQALASVTAVEAAINGVLAEVRALVAPRVPSALSLATEARALLRIPGVPHRISGEPAELDDAVVEAEQNLRGVPELPAQAPATAEHMNAAQLGLARVGELEAATRRLLTAVTAEHDALRPQVNAAENLAARARAVLSQTGDRQDSLGRELAAATARLREITPGWWTDSGTVLETVPQAEAAGAALVAEPAELARRAQDVERIGNGVLAADETAADDTAQQRADVLLALIGQVRDLLPYTTRPDSLRASLDDAARHTPQRVDDLQAAMEAVLTEATDPLPDRVTAARALFTRLGEEPPLTEQQRQELDSLVGMRQDPRGVVAASPDLGAAVAAVRQGMTALTAMETAARQALDQGALYRRARAALAPAQAVRGLPAPGGAAGRTGRPARAGHPAVRSALSDLTGAAGHGRTAHPGGCA